MKIRPLAKTHGGKNFLKDFIISYFPSNYTSLIFIEGCVGGGSIILNKKRSIVEIVNDIDPSLIAIIKELSAEDPTSFINLVKEIEYNKETFEWSKTITEVNPIAELVRRRFSRGGLRESFAWSERLRGGRFGDVNAWETYKEHLPIIANRLKGVEVYCMPVCELIEKFDGDNVLLYLDPPYILSSRKSPKAYAYEMTDNDHIELAERLNKAKSKVLLSGYQSPLYAKLYKNWNLVSKVVANHSSQAKSKEKRVELLWMNY